MKNRSSAYRNTLLILWAALAVIGYFYSSQQHIPTRIAAWLFAALATEAIFYLAPGFAWSRAQVDSIEPPAVRALILSITALVPYLIYSLGTGTFHWRSFGLLALMATFVSAWFVAQKSTLADLLFAALLAAILLSKAFDGIYITLARKADAPILGTLMLVRTSALSVTSIRKMGGIGFSFLPAARDWLIGVLAFSGFLALMLFVNNWLHAVDVRLAPGPWWRVALVGVGTFLAFLWVSSLFEEFVTRGIVQQAITRRLGALAGLLITSVLFGLAHLPFRSFPNWKWVIVATLLGLFCGLAYQRTGAIRAAVVTHALVVATWRVFFA